MGDLVLFEDEVHPVMSATLDGDLNIMAAAGLLERDGLFILGGYVAFGLNLVFFCTLRFLRHQIFRGAVDVDRG